MHEANVDVTVKMVKINSRASRPRTHRWQIDHSNFLFKMMEATAWYYFPLTMKRARSWRVVADCTSNNRSRCALKIAHSELRDKKILI